MRVALLTNLTARASQPVLERLVASQQVDLRHIFFYNTLAAGRASPLKVLRQFGWKTLVSKIVQVVHGKLRSLLVRALGKSWIAPRSAHELAVMRGLPHSLTSDINSRESTARLVELGVDVLLVCVCKNILLPGLLTTPNLRFVNIHPSLLPDYRGPTPTFWMLYHGEQQTGYTIHHMTPQVDRGAILAQGGVPLDNRKSELQIELQVFSAASVVLVETLLSLENTVVDARGPNQLEDGSANGSSVGDKSSQGDGRHASPGSYHTYPTPRQRRELRERLRVANG